MYKDIIDSIRVANALLIVLMSVLINESLFRGLALFGISNTEMMYSYVVGWILIFNVFCHSCELVQCP